MNMGKEPVGRISFANGDKTEFIDPKDYVAAIKKEIGYRSTSGFNFETLTKDPEVLKAVDDIVMGEYGLRNLMTVEDYALPEDAAGRPEKYIKRANESSLYLQLRFEEPPCPVSVRALHQRGFSWSEPLQVWQHPMDGEEKYDYDKLVEEIGKPMDQEFGPPFSLLLTPREEELQKIGQDSVPFEIFTHDGVNYCVKLRITPDADGDKNFRQEAFDQFAKAHGVRPIDEQDLHAFGSAEDWKRIFRAAFKDMLGIERVDWGSEATSVFCNSDNYDLMKICITEMKQICDDPQRLSAAIEAGLLAYVSAEAKAREYLEQYPPGTRVQVVYKEHPTSRATSMQGSVVGVTNAGELEVLLDNGATTQQDPLYGDRVLRLEAPEQNEAQQIGGMSLG